MNTDQIIKCAVCDVSFVWMASEQDDPRPDRCPMCRRLAPDVGRQRGVVKWYSRGKGYGFISPVEGTDVFLHKSGLRPEQMPCAGQLVEFTVTHGPRGIQASDVEILRTDSDAAC